MDLCCLYLPMLALGTFIKIFPVSLHPRIIVECTFLPRKVRWGQVICFGGKKNVSHTRGSQVEAFNNQREIHHTHFFRQLSHLGTLETHCPLAWVRMMSSRVPHPQPQWTRVMSNKQVLFAAAEVWSRSLRWYNPSYRTNTLPFIYSPLWNQARLCFLSMWFGEQG